MNTTTFFAQYRAVEERLVARYAAHPFLTTLAERSAEEIRDALLQLGCVSERFVWWYEQTKLGMDDERAKELVRNILRDEIPRDAPTHQDDRLADLCAMGLTTGEVLLVGPTPTTKDVIAELVGLTTYSPVAAYNDLRALVGLRVAGEILVAETYRPIVAIMEDRFGLAPAASRFYAPHAMHDDARTGSHAHAFVALIEEQIVDERALRFAAYIAHRATAARSKLLDQFVE